MTDRTRLDVERRLRVIDDNFYREHPLDWATGVKRAEEFTSGMVALIAYYVRNWGRGLEDREPLLDIQLPSHAEVMPFLSDEQKQRINIANAPLLALQRDRYGEDPVWDNIVNDDEERE